MADEAILFIANTPLGFPVGVARERWQLIVTAKHPAMRGREDEVRTLLDDPDEVRRSTTDPRVLLFYRTERPRRWLCAVIKQQDGDGFLITSYPTDAIKVGERVWSR